jgi:hypothetical protein
MIFEYTINDIYYYYNSIIKSFKFYKILVTPIENKLDRGSVQLHNNTMKRYNY